MRSAITRDTLRDDNPARAIRYDTIRYGLGLEAIISDNMINHHMHVDVGVFPFGNARYDKRR